jgi:hypothetical protein
MVPNRTAPSATKAMQMTTRFMVPPLSRRKPGSEFSHRSRALIAETPISQVQPKIVSGSDATPGLGQALAARDLRVGDAAGCRTLGLVHGHPAHPPAPNTTCRGQSVVIIDWGRVATTSAVPGISALVSDVPRSAFYGEIALGRPKNPPAEGASSCRLVSNGRP